MSPRSNKPLSKAVSGLFTTSKTLHSKSVYVKTANSAPHRISFVVPKNLGLGAVKRNLLKRRGRSIVEEFKLYTPLKKTIVFVLKKDAGKRTYGELRKEILFLLDRVM